MQRQRINGRFFVSMVTGSEDIRQTMTIAHLASGTCSIMREKKTKLLVVQNQTMIGERRNGTVRKLRLLSTAALLAAVCSAMQVNASEVLQDVMATYDANTENNYRIDYLEEDPYLTNVYEGFGFAKDYTSAIGHSYCLEDVSGTARPHPLANCLTCKTEDFTKLVNELGVDAYKLDFEETFADMKTSVGCYSCHGDEAADGTLTVTHSYVEKGLGEQMGDVAPAALACGQCHIEYYFDPETKETLMPYTGIEGMAPEAILAYYDEMGFSDWTQESTGTGLLKAQHPEFETFMNGSVHAGMNMTCASCHMAVETNEAGTEFVSHKWESPLANEKLLETCAACHKDTDMAEKVGAIQEEIIAAEKATGESLSALKTALAEAVAGGEYTEDELNAIRPLYRSAQWFWDFCYVENSEGAHNSALSKACLAKADELIAEAMGLFK